MEKLDILTGTQASDDYPYGRLRCHIEFSVEFVPKKGFRAVTQTTNPKTGRVNKPKKSTYSQFVCMYRDAETGHVKFAHLVLRGYEDIAQMIEFLTVNDVEFTPEQSKFLWVQVITCIRGNAAYTRLAEHASSKQFAETTRYAQMVEKFKENKDFNEIKEVGYDLAAIRALCA